MPVQTLIFDFGGVIYDIDFDRAARSFRQLGIPRFDELYSKARQSGVFEQLEKGALSERDFYNALKPYFETRVPSFNEVMNAWNDLLIGFKKERIDYLRALTEDYELLLLSNTNSIHYEQFSMEFRDQFRMSLESLFKEAVFSHRCNMRKPEPEIYKKVLQAASCAPQNCLFIDDTPHNLPPAEELGINTVLHRPQHEIQDVLPGILAKFNQ